MKNVQVKYWKIDKLKGIFIHKALISFNGCNIYIIYSFVSNVVYNTKKDGGSF